MAVSDYIPERYRNLTASLTEEGFRLALKSKKEATGLKPMEAF